MRAEEFPGYVQLPAEEVDIVRSVLRAVFKNIPFPARTDTLRQLAGPIQFEGAQAHSLPLTHILNIGARDEFESLEDIVHLVAASIAADRARTHPATPSADSPYA